MSTVLRKVLIVDDEKRIAELIRSLIHWEELGLTCIGLKMDGEMAWETIREEHPDIVITDIRMPVMSGLEMIRKAREEEIPVDFIVMSGYQEFEYAHTAMQYGVESYLVKPVDEEELNRCLADIRQRVQKEAELQEENRTLREKVEKSEWILKQNFLRNIIEQRETSPDSEVDLRGEIYRGVDIKLDHIDPRNSNVSQEQFTLENVTKIIVDFLQPQVEQLLVCSKEYMHIYVLCCYSEEADRQIGERISSLLLQIKEHLRIMDQFHVTIGIGKAKHVFSEIRFSILESYIAVCNRIVYGTGRLIWADSVFLGENAGWSERERLVRQKILHDADALIAEHIPSYVHEIYGSRSELEQVNMAAYYEGAEQTIDSFFSHLGIEEEVRAKLQKQVLNGIHHCHRAVQLSDLMAQFFQGCIGSAKEALESQLVKPVRMAQQYVEEHYREKILLEDVAEVVGLNPVYFSALFKKETSLNFSTYLIDFRMEKAKELLTTTNDTISAIAGAVGYPEQKYFSQQFKKVVGVKPVIYRQLHS